MGVAFHRGPLPTLTIAVVVALGWVVNGCTDDVAQSDGDTGTSGDGDGDPSTGDGDPSTGDGDGDSDPACGNGIVEGDEQCDDGNDNDADACLNDCTLPACGDGVTQSGEQCDDGNRSNDDACTNLCQHNVCGDGFVDLRAEACDDGNLTDADGCEADCSTPACANGIVDPGELCLPSDGGLTSSTPGPVRAVAIADLDDDGNLDVLAAVDHVDAIHVWLGDGAGGFGDALITAGTGPAKGSGLHVADLDDDGKLDVAYASNSASVLFGDGEGGFDAAVVANSCGTIVHVALADVDADERLDVACTGIAGALPQITELRTARNLGGRSFAPSTSVDLVVQTIYTEIVGQDLDGDGRDDLATLDYSSGQLKIWYQTEPGVLTLATASVGPNGWSLIAGDIDGDDAPDLLASFPKLDDSGTAVVPYVQTNAVFTAEPTLDGGQGPRGLALADLDGDGHSDAIVGIRGSNEVAVFSGDGAGGFGPAQSFPVGSQPSGVATGDLDGDGALDVAVANFGNDSVSVLIATP